MTVCALAFITVFHGLAETPNDVLTNVAAVLSAVDQKEFGKRFEFTAQALTPFGAKCPWDVLAVEDDSGAITMLRNQAPTNPPVISGDIVLVRGYVDISQFAPSCARVSKIERIRREKAPQSRQATASDIFAGKYDSRLVNIRGVVRDAFFDDVDSQFCALVIDSCGGRINAVVPSKGIDNKRIDGLINAEVSISGLCLKMVSGIRRMNGRHIRINDIEDIKVLQTAKDSLFDTQNLEDLRTMSATDIANLGRRRVFGKVLAVWNRNNVLLKHAEKDIVRVELANGLSPAYGDRIEAVGFPETDLYFINLSRSVWKTLKPTREGLEPAEETSASRLLFDSAGQRQVQASYHGRAIRIRGTVRSVPSALDNGERIIVDDGSVNVPIDVSAQPDIANGLTIGCQVEISGTCVIEIENWRPNAIFPRIKGFFVVPRVPSDIRILKHPPWWTPGRLFTVIGTLLAVLVGILLWNTTLRRRVERRSRELSQETVARVTSELKVGERTRLAMELHDSIVQSLTGVSMEIRTADRIADEDRTGMHQHLSLAVKTLDSCRKDLRNCLWDLRNQTLEDEDVSDAIRRTLAPHIGGTELAVRFNVPREMFCDNTAHTILRIIRELATNAVQHGKATSIKVAGSVEAGKLLFSVKDNGCGFDPERAPGMAQGHFGLQGIRDRIEAFEGEMSVQSASGKGTKISIALTVPQGVEEVLT